MACHCQDHDSCDLEKEEAEDSKKEVIKNVVKLVVGAVLLAIAYTLGHFDSTYGEISWSMFADTDFYTSLGFFAFLIYTIAYVFLLIDLVKECIEETKEGNYVNEFTLMIVATLGAYAINEYPEAILVLLFNIVGEMLEDYATRKSSASIKGLISDMPLYAHYVNLDNTIVEKTPEDLKIGDVIEIKPGEKVPVDCRLLKGQTSIDLSSINGESLPKDVFEGDLIYSGAINLSSNIKVEVAKEYKDSTLTKIMDLVENEETKKAKSEKFITRFAKYYTPIVALIAVLVFVIGYGASGFNWEASGYTWLYRALSLLLISCPCALVISVPVAFFSAIGRASKLGILIKGSLALENIKRSDVFAFDKTGTLTKGDFVLENEVDSKYLQIAASLESKSTHPLGKAITSANREPLLDVVDFLNVPGLGIQGKIEDTTYYIGSKAYLEKQNIADIVEPDTPFKVLYLASDKSGFLASFIVADQVKDEAKEVLADLKAEGVKETVMLSGDDQKIADAVGSRLGIDVAKGNLLPEDKLNNIKDLAANNCLAYVGDGINDSPSLLASSAGIAMGALGSDAAIEAADIVVMNDDLKKVAEVKRLSKITMRIVYTGVAFALIIKILFMVLVSVGVLGDFAMIAGVVSDTGVMALCVLYAMSLLFYKPKYLSQKKEKTSPSAPAPKIEAEAI